MARVALGQSKLVARPFAGLMHVFIYLGFVIINIEILEIVVDGVFGTHRALKPFWARKLIMFSLEFLRFLLYSF